MITATTSMEIAATTPTQGMARLRSTLSTTPSDLAWRVIGLLNLYRLLGLAVPAALDQPISVGRGAPEAGGVMRRATAN